jgi:hypothetical protein
MKFLLVLLFPTLALANADIEDAKKSVLSLIRPLMAQNSKTAPKGTENFRVDGCDKKKIDWMKILLMRETATLDFKFKKNCDIQGSISPKVLQPFSAKLDIRNLRNYNQIQTENKITADLQNKPILNLEMRQGLLSGKGKMVKFDADYKVQINPMSENAMEKNLGGELRITEIDGKKVDIKEKILVE